jgi:hypothetical protein
MSQLKIADIVNFIKQLQGEGMTIGEIYELPVYLGDDDELNGIHCAWYTNLVDKNNSEDADLVEMINEDRCNIKLEGKAILIS